MFQTKASQVAVADEFAVYPKKMHMACLGRKYHPRKKPLKKKQKATTVKEKTEPEGKPLTSTEAMEPVNTLEGTAGDSDNLLYREDDTLPDPFDVSMEEPKLFHTKDPAKIKWPK